MAEQPKPLAPETVLSGIPDFVPPALGNPKLGPVTPGLAASPSGDEAYNIFRQVHPFINPFPGQVVPDRPTINGQPTGQNDVTNPIFAIGNSAAPPATPAPDTTGGGKNNVPTIPNAPASAAEDAAQPVPPPATPPAAEVAAQSAPPATAPAPAAPATPTTAAPHHHGGGRHPAPSYMHDMGPGNHGNPGSHGKEVRDAQTMLNALGTTPPLKEDADFGKATSDAVRKFQHDHHLPETGDLKDEATKEALIKAFQEEYNKKHPAKPSIIADGKEGPQTEDALKTVRAERAAEDIARHPTIQGGHEQDSHEAPAVTPARPVSTRQTGTPG